MQSIFAPKWRVSCTLRGAAIEHSGGDMDENKNAMHTSADSTPDAEKERLAYSIKEAAQLLGVDYFSVYRLIQRGKLRACRALRGKLLVPRSELLRLLKV
jgi:excisionase family DNA binding protein